MFKAKLPLNIRDRDPAVVGRDGPTAAETARGHTNHAREAQNSQTFIPPASESRGTQREELVSLVKVPGDCDELLGGRVIDPRVEVLEVSSLKKIALAE